MKIILKLFPDFSHMYAYILLPEGIAAWVFGSLNKMNLSNSIPLKTFTFLICLYLYIHK